MGRPALVEGEYARPIAFTLASIHTEKLEHIKRETGLNRSEIIRQLIESATPQTFKEAF